MKSKDEKFILLIEEEDNETVHVQKGTCCNKHLAEFIIETLYNSDPEFLLSIIHALDDMVIELEKKYDPDKVNKN